MAISYNSTCSLCIVTIPHTSQFQKSKKSNTHRQNNYNTATTTAYALRLIIDERHLIKLEYESIQHHNLWMIECWITIGFINSLLNDYSGDMIV